MTADNSADMEAIVAMLRKLDAKQEQLSAQVRACFRFSAKLMSSLPPCNRSKRHPRVLTSFPVPNQASRHRRTASTHSAVHP